MKVAEIFYSLQGEGANSGTPAVFVRFAGCNLRCPFCDTVCHHAEQMSEPDIVAAVSNYPARLVVVTGGEPSLQLTHTLVDSLHRQNRIVAVETNGTRPLPSNVDWITLSPKDLFLGSQAKPVLSHADELKVVFDGVHTPHDYSSIIIRHARYLQPCDTGDPQRNKAIADQTVEYIKANPQWRLSMQIHKLVGIK